MWATTTFATNNDVRLLQARIDLSAQLQLAAEIRLQSLVRCTSPDKEAITRTIDKLQVEYKAITGDRYPEGSCS